MKQKAKDDILGDDSSDLPEIDGEQYNTPYFVQF